MVMTLSFRRGDFDLSPRPREALVLYGQSAKARTVSDDQGLDFLSFPQKVRDSIYSFIFVKPTFIGSGVKFTKPFYRDVITWRNLAFAGTCRQIWNESLKVYLASNGFEFFYIRPFLEFLEKIGIRGRRLLTNVRWHHHKRSRPFIVLRYLRSCTALQTLRIFARVTVENRKNFWWGVPLLNAKMFFLSDYHKIEFGTAQAFGKVAEAREVPPDFGANIPETHSLVTLSENLRKVKWEVSGEYKRYDLPRIWENGMCHWKYKMIDEKKKQKKQQKAKINRQKEGAQSNNQEDKEPEESFDPHKTDSDVGHGDEDDEMIDGDDGYLIQNGDLVKDGIVIASGTVFETGIAFEDGHPVGDITGVCNGDDSDMILGDETHIAADDTRMDGEMMLWEPQSVQDRLEVGAQD